MLRNLVLIACVLAGCRSSAPHAEQDGAAASVERAKQEQQLAEAEWALARNPRGEEELIWVGRRLGYLGRFDEAQATFSRGLELHPDSWKILRHRGHRWITLRRFDRAVDDLSRAWMLCREEPDEIEPDGQPNAAGIPIGSYHSNVIYHLALAHYLRGEWNAACDVWDQGRASSTQNADRLCSSTYWNVLALRRAGRDAEARTLLAAIQGPMTILENESYRQLCLLLKGEFPATGVLQDVESGTVEFATRAYGLACWHRFNGEEQAATELLERIVAGGPQNAFGCIAAEADSKRDAGTRRESM